ncbi:hypothetical protein AVEN_217623-1 [Araneus ventricosus]|uniref:Uncharacterized protein n=1 Tax=Araneus ventricosus TaxID=182803 RepID=A0A4Y2TZM1_ARAVE|nr:hypothetical protein AVEN_217623-1 [Araneus ventricosus]
MARAYPVRSLLWGRRIPLKIRRASGLLNVKSYVGGTKYPVVGVVRKFGWEVPCQVSSTLLGRGSKLRGPSQNSPRAALKWDINITKLNLSYPVLPRVQRL